MWWIVFPEGDGSGLSHKNRGTLARLGEVVKEFSSRGDAMTELVSEVLPMTPLTTGTSASPSSPPDPTQWATALQTLKDLLSRDGCVSSKALRAALELRGVQNPRAMVIRLRYFDFDAPLD